MPLHPDFQKIFDAMKKKYGEKGKDVFYAYINKHGYDETKSMKGQTSKAKEFTVDEEDLNDLFDEFGQEVDEKAFGDASYPDSCFMYVPAEAKGENGKKSLRKLPYKNVDGSISLPHVRNALARLNQTEGISDSEKARIKKRLENILSRENPSYKPSEKEFLTEEKFEAVAEKSFYGAVMPIISVKSVETNGEENYFVEGFISTPLTDLQGETVDLKVLEDWQTECVKPPHNLVWISHESPYKIPDAKAKPAIMKWIESSIKEFKTKDNQTVKGLWAKGVFNKNHPEFKTVWEDVKNGFINALSAEFIPLEENPISKILTKAKYLATCLVKAPANDSSTIVSAYTKAFKSATGDSLEALLRERDRVMVESRGPPAATPPASSPSTIPPQVAAPPIDATTQKLNEILTQFQTFRTDIDSKISTIKTEVEGLKPPVEKPPTAEEIQRVLKHLNEKGRDYFAPKPQTPPTAQPTIPPPATIPPATKSYTEDELQEKVHAAVIEERSRKDVVRKSVDGVIEFPTHSTTDLIGIPSIDSNSIEGMLKLTGFGRKQVLVSD